MEEKLQLINEEWEKISAEKFLVVKYLDEPLESYSKETLIKIIQLEMHKMRYFARQ